MKHIGFKLNDKEYTIPILKVREVIMLPTITRLPLSPHYIEGITYLRGSVLPLVNLKKLVGLTGDFLGEKVMVVGSDRLRFGFFVDGITGILEIKDSNLHEPPPGEFEYHINVDRRDITCIDTKRILPEEALSLKNGNGESLFIDPDFKA